MDTSTTSLAVLDTVNSIRLKNWNENTGNCENGNGNAFLNYLGQLVGISSSCHRYEVTALVPNGKTPVGEHRLFEGMQTKSFWSTQDQDEKIDFCDSNQRSILQVEFKSCRTGFLGIQNHMELHVSTNGLTLGKITHEPQKNKFIIEDQTSPSVSYDMVQTRGVSDDETFCNYSIYYSTLPHTIFQRQPSSFLAAEISEGQDDGTEALISFKDKGSQTPTCQSLSSQAKALLIGLMALMTTLAPERLQRQIYNEAAYKASIILLY